MKILALLLASVVCASAAPFEIKEGDRVLLLGDALLERENTYGLLETRMHEQFPNVKFTVRNLSWSGETPKGWSRASFDGPEKGWERLKEQIAEVKPTVAILGFGMAASLQEMTDRSGDQTLNPDPVRYGAEPMSAARFQKEMRELMDVIKAGSPTIRFVLLSPFGHEDLRSLRPGLPDPKGHNELLQRYSQALDNLTAPYSAPVVRTGVSMGSKNFETQEVKMIPLTENGIHLSQFGHGIVSDRILSALGLGSKLGNGPQFEKMNEALRAAVLKKNDLFFHQFRPANSTYLFGFRKHEQGKNAAEMPKFTPLIEAADAEIDRLKRQAAGAKAEVPSPGAPAPAPALAAAATSAPVQVTQKLPLPNFTVTDNLEITLWADTDLVGKPVGMNWDAAGRLWVACSPVYPQITPGGHPDDKVVVIEDTDHDGKADKSTNFASNFVIAAGVAPDFGTPPPAAAPAKSSPPPSTTSIKSTPSITAAYVGASTELVRVEDTDGDGKGDTRRIIVSGFGTEDTHHTIHTLRWGPDGRLYFNQSIYIHSHMETPYGMVRLNSGGICSYDPRTERIEVFARGFINTWGHAWDKWGQSFASDGAGFEGIHWLIPGAMYRTYEGARRILPSISPGSYPKYSGLEIVQSPLFPDDWQGNAITCDFRAHKITRFQINDLSQPNEPGKEPLSGYITKELPNPIVTSDASFRPIDVKHGPDGALYIADWTNPIINHGEVDFRDPRRDHVNGRIWRVAQKGKAALKWESQVGKDAAGLAQSALSESSRWENDSAIQAIRGTLTRRLVEERLFRMTFDKHPLMEGDSNHTWGPLKAAARDVQKVLKNSLGNHVYLGHLIEMAIGGGPFSEETAPFNIEVQVASKPGDRGIETVLLPGGVTGPLLRTSKDARLRSIWARFAGSMLAHSDPEVLQLSVLKKLAEPAKDPNARVRIEAMRALARIPTVESVSLLLEAALNVPGGAPKQIRSEDKGTNQFNQPTFADTADPYYGYAAWLSINELDDVWLKAVIDGTWPKQVDSSSYGEAARAELAAIDKRIQDLGLGSNPIAELTKLLTKLVDDLRTAEAAGKKSEVARLNADMEKWREKMPPFCTIDDRENFDATLGNVRAALKHRANYKSHEDFTNQQFAFALSSIRPEKATQVLSLLLKKNGLPRDGSGPWIELIGQAGGPPELALLFEGIFAKVKSADGVPFAEASRAFTTPEANRRAAAALLTAARRGLKPANLSPADADLVTIHSPDEAASDIIRLAGLWKINAPDALLSHIASKDAPAPLKDAVFESLRTLGTKEAIASLTAFLAPTQQPAVDSPTLRAALQHNDAATRRRALAALATVRADKALGFLTAVLNEADTAGQLPLWRELFSSEPFTKALLKNVPQLTKEQAAPALRAARELGKRGEQLVAALTPLAGEAPAAAPATHDIASLVDLTKKNGNPVEGELIYRRAALTCTVCHAIGGAGGKTGPDLGTLGASAPLDYIIESTVNPAAKVKEGFHAIAVTTKDGKTLSGTVAKESDTAMTLRDMTGAEQSVEKNNIKERTNIGSLMPAGLTATLTPREQSNLFAFLAQLGKSGPFDASKASVARAWRVYPGDQVEAVVAGKADAAKATPVYSLVDGRVTKDLLEIPVAIAGDQPTIVAVSRFALVNGGQHRLHLAGITKAWLNGQPLAIASDPNPVIDLPAGEHTLAVKLDTKTLPTHFRAECPDARFLTE